MVNVKESAPESEEQKFKIKCQELRKRIAEVEESNEISALALSRTRVSIRRLRLEYAVLLERLESQVLLFLQDEKNQDEEAMARPFEPLLVDESLDFKQIKSKGPKGKRGKNGVMSAAALKRAARDPNLPKRPTNAYLMFCEREKDRVRAEMEKDNPGKPATELTRVLTDMWKALDDTQKIPYLKLYEEDRERYRREMVVYNMGKQDAADAVAKKGKHGKGRVTHLEEAATDDPDTPGADADVDEENDTGREETFIDEEEGDDGDDGDDGEAMDEAMDESGLEEVDETDVFGEPEEGDDSHGVNDVDEEKSRVLHTEGELPSSGSGLDGTEDPEIKRRKFE